MNIIGHRGLWESASEQNSLQAFMRALDKGIGIELDVFLLDGSLVVTHDPPDSSSTYTQLADVLDLVDGMDSISIAINVKQDGLVDALTDVLPRHREINYFCFDMSIPETIKYLSAGLRFAVRASEFEHPPAELLVHASAIWLDSLKHVWWSHSTLKELHSVFPAGQIVIVSPELHGRTPKTAWDVLDHFQDEDCRLALCTDFVAEARSFFG